MFTSLKPTIETPKHMWNLFKVNNEDIRTMSTRPRCLVSLLLTVTVNSFHTFLQNISIDCICRIVYTWYIHMFWCLLTYGKCRDNKTVRDAFFNLATNTRRPLRIFVLVSLLSTCISVEWETTQKWTVRYISWSVTKQWFLVKLEQISNKC